MKRKGGAELLLYLIFGVLTTAVNLIAFLLFGLIFTERLYLLSNLLAWAVAVAFAFVTNKLFVFRERSTDGRTVLSELWKFTLARVLSLGVEELGLFLLVDALGMGDISVNIGFTVSGQMLAKCVLAVIVVVMNYFFSKLIIFRKIAEKEKSEK